MNFLEACKSAKNFSVKHNGEVYVYLITKAEDGTGIYGMDWFYPWMKSQGYQHVRTYLKGKDITYNASWNSPFMKLPPGDTPLVLVDRHGKEFEGRFEVEANLFMRPLGTTSCGEMFVQAPNIVKWRLK